VTEPNKVHEIKDLEPGPLGILLRICPVTVGVFTRQGSFLVSPVRYDEINS
jgi:hypothetical protein